MTYVKRILIAIDQLAGTVFLGQYPDETISAAAHRRHWKKFERVINFIMQDPNHCAAAYVAEMKHTQEPQEYR